MNKAQLDLFDEDAAELEDSGRETASEYMRRLNRRIHRLHFAWNAYEQKCGRKTRPCPCRDCRKFQKRSLYVIMNHWGYAWHLEWFYDGSIDMDGYEPILGGESFECDRPESNLFHSIEDAVAFARSQGFEAIVHPSAIPVTETAAIC